MSKQEIWKPVVGFEGRYEVSNWGRVRSYLTRNKRRRVVPLILRLSEDAYGYLQAGLHHTDKRTTAKVHRLVAAAFMPPEPFEKATINHIDGNKQNNNVCNLEWCTYAENIRHAVLNGKWGARKIPIQIMLDIVRRHREGETQTALAKEFGITQSCISHTLRNIKKGTWIN